MGTSKVSRVKANDLTIDPRVQRNVDLNRVRKIANAIRLSAIGVIHVSERPNGKKIVLDGWHRCSALVKSGNGDVEVDAKVYYGLTLQQEAELFRLLNTTQKVGFTDTFRVRLIEGEAIALEVEALCAKNGWRVDGSENNEALPKLYSVKKLEQLYREDPTTTGIVLDVASTAWKQDINGVDYRILDGLYKFLRRHGVSINLTDLTTRLAHYPGGPGQIIEKAHGVRKAFNMSSVGLAIGFVLTDLYNKGKRQDGGNKLPSWLA